MYYCTDGTSAALPLLYAFLRSLFECCLVPPLLLAAAAATAAVTHPPIPMLLPMVLPMQLRMLLPLPSPMLPPLLLQLWHIDKESNLLIS